MTSLQETNVKPRPAAGVQRPHARLREQARRAARRGYSRAAGHLRLVIDNGPVEKSSNAAAAVLDERTRIARELHDTVAQTLYAITLSASRALRLTDAAPLKRLVEDVIQLANDGQEELRAMLASYRSDALVGEGLTSALADLAAGTQTRYGLDVRLAVGDEPDIPPAAKEAVARIAQEALQNVAKHAEAGRVDMVLNAGAEVVLLITDNGRGFDPQLAHPGHFGLQSMHERAEAAGGTLEVISAVGYGTLIRLRVPRTVK